MILSEEALDGYAKQYQSRLKSASETTKTKRSGVIAHGRSTNKSIRPAGS